MKSIQLIRLDPALEQELANDGEYCKAMAEDDWTRLAEVVRRVVGRTLGSLPATVDEPHWSGYFAVDRDTRKVVGSCAFKTPPTDDGVVEMAYFTYPGFEGQGYATTMALELIELASRSPMVRQVIAHTLPDKNASTRVLERVGMTFVGEVMDPEDGRVWRWQVEVGA